MKPTKLQLTTLGLAAVLALGANSTLADKRDHREYRGGKHHQEFRGGRWDSRHREFRGRHKGWYGRDKWDRHRGGHYRKRYYRGGRVFIWGGPRYRYDYPGYLGSALIGSAITYSFFHNHGGATCYDSHAAVSGPRYEVVGCHRIEYLPDGTQRRVEVPLSSCR